MSNASNAERWFERVGRGEDPGRRMSSNVLYDGADALYSYGKHFALVVPLHNEDGSVRLWLLNGDNVSVTTSGHQSMVRGLASRSDIPSMILPFSALHAAGIYEYEAIVPVEIKDDWFTEEPYTCKSYCVDANGVRREQGCGETHMRQVHHLGASVFEATFNEDRGKRTERFLSAFDEQERAGGLYFLCQLPSWAQVTSYEEAIQALKPVEVVKAEAMGETVTRQGDIFAIPEPTLTKRELRSMGATISKGKTAPKFEPYIERWTYQDCGDGGILGGAVIWAVAHAQRYERELWESQRSLLHTAHTATEIAVVDEDHVFARGCLYHEPSIVGRWGERDHARRKIGDGKQWHRIVQNTVPQGQSWAPRAWTMGGRVD